MASGPRSKSDRRPAVGLAATVLAVFFTACDSVDTGPHPFVALPAATTGITFVNDVSGSRDYPLPEITGSGCAIADLDADGRPDVAAVGLLGAGEGGRLEIFWQGRDGRFDEGPRSPLNLSSTGMGVAVGDLTNDGLPEILVTCEHEDHLFHNLGGRRFEDVTPASGYDNPAWGAGACFVDVDRDGWLDIFVVNYVSYEDRPCGRGGGGPRDYCPPHLFAPTIDRLFRNVTGMADGGDGGPRLVDRTAAAGLAAARGPGLGCTAADLTGDGWPDLYVANDQAPNRLWVNQGDGTFRDEAVLRGCAVDALGRSQAGMGVVVDDLDADGHWDLFLTHLEGEYHTLYRGLGRGLFEDATAAAGLVGPTRPFTGFGVASFDVEHDGDPDLVCVAGRVQRHPDAPAEPRWSAYRQRGVLLWNDGDRFREEPRATGPLSSPAVARGLAVGDIDADGDLDVVVNRTDEPLLVLANAAAAGHWIRVRPTLPECGGREAIGAVVTVVTPSRSFRRLLQPNMGYLSSHEPCVHVGLAEATVVERIDVAWPDGSLSSHAAGPADRAYTIAGPGSGAAVPSVVGESRP